MVLRYLLVPCPIIIAMILPLNINIEEAFWSKTAHPTPGAVGCMCVKNVSWPNAQVKCGWHKPMEYDEKPHPALAAHIGLISSATFDPAALGASPDIDNNSTV